MAIDEVVYTRESLKRSLKALLEVVDKAAENYDPSEVINVDDIMVVAMTMGVRERVTDYVKALQAHKDAIQSLSPSDR